MGRIDMERSAFSEFVTVAVVLLFVWAIWHKATDWGDTPPPYVPPVYAQPYEVAELAPTPAPCHLSDWSEECTTFTWEQ